MLVYIKDRVDDFDVKSFVNELAAASKNLGILEAKIDSYQFNRILIPILQKKEAISSMYIEGTQTTITDVLKSEINPQPNDEKIQTEVQNHVRTLIYGADYLRTGKFDALNALYSKTKNAVKECINSPKFDEIIECLFTHPVLNAHALEDQLAVSHGQAVRYLNVLEEKRILLGDDRKRGKTFFFVELLDLARGL